MAALWINQSTDSSASSRDSAVIVAESAKSSAWRCRVSGCCSASLVSSVDILGSRAVACTRQPSSSSWRTSSRPMPRLVPVISAVFIRLPPVSRSALRGSFGQLKHQLAVFDPYGFHPGVERLPEAGVIAELLDQVDASESANPGVWQRYAPQADAGDDHCQAWLAVRAWSLAHLGA